MGGRRKGSGRKKCLDLRFMPDDAFNSLATTHMKKWTKRCKREGDCEILMVVKKEGDDGGEKPEKRTTVSMRIHGTKKPVTTINAARAFYMFTHRLKHIKGEVSHLCHNKRCVNVRHLTVEEHTKNESRNQCVQAGRCVSDAAHSPPCLL